MGNSKPNRAISVRPDNSESNSKDDELGEAAQRSDYRGRAPVPPYLDFRTGCVGSNPTCWAILG